MIFSIRLLICHIQLNKQKYSFLGQYRCNSYNFYFSVIFQALKLKGIQIKPTKYWYSSSMILNLHLYLLNVKIDELVAHFQKSLNNKKKSIPRINFKIKRAMYRMILCLILIIIPSATAGVMQITLNNLRNVLATYEQLFILFHNPQCLHSRKYVETFLKIESSQKLGIVDCLREVQLCSKYNFTQFPILTKLGIDGWVQIVDEQDFLVRNDLKKQHEDQPMLNRFVKYLQEDPFYAVLVFEDYGMPTLTYQRISQIDEKIFYLQPSSEQNPSNFTKLLSSLVQNKPGCWIFKKNLQNQLQKYYCDSGYSKKITLKYLNLFKEEKLKPYTFSKDQQQTNDRSVKQFNAQQLYNLLERLDQGSCNLIYVSSGHCSSCREKDVYNVKYVLKSLSLERKIQLGKYNIDENQIPPKLTNLGLKRVPELMYICGKKVRVFGEVFFIDSIQSFVEKSHLGIGQVFENQNKQQKKNQEQVKGKVQQF